MRVISPKVIGTPDQELKEAVCDAIVNLTTDRVSGNDQAGEIVYGRSPKRIFVAGLLLPRFDEHDQSDETSDIRISALGIDSNIATNATGNAELKPSFSTYVRVLPTWDELQNSRYGLEVDFDLDPTLELQIKDTIRMERKKRFAAEGLDQVDPKDMSSEQRRSRKLRREAIRREVAQAAYKQHGIELTDDDVNAIVGESTDGPLISNGLPLNAEDPEAEKRVEESISSENSDPSIVPEGGDVVRVAKLLRNCRRVPLNLLRPADIPIKWRRLRLDLPSLSWPLDASAEALEARLQRYNTELQEAATKAVTDWITSDQGKEQAWRPIQITPTDISSREAWSAFLARAQAITPPLDRLLPAFGRVKVTVDKLANYLDPLSSSLRVTLENDNPEFSHRIAKYRCDTLFQAGLTLRIPDAAHQVLLLDRVEPSYRFRHHMRYPGMGLNCGVSSHEEPGLRVLSTTWSPKFVQPRIVARQLNVPCDFATLADEGFNCTALLKLPDTYRSWVAASEAALRVEAVAGLSPEDAAAEIGRLERDLEGQRREARYIERGIRLLIEAQSAFRARTSTLGQAEAATLERKAMPYRAWLLMNSSFLRRENGDKTKSWRLFQLAFVLAHLPTLASRMPEYKTWHDPELDEDSASLLYFPTGGGKSEAFYGTLIFAMFLDRLKGKSRGVTAMIRYPLRLLTLQQAQRFLRLLINAELVRKAEHVGTWSFEIGFWVGKTNTPNRFAQVSADIPRDDEAKHSDDSLLIPENLSADADQGTIDQAYAYEENLLAYNKIPNCPVCGKTTGLRRIFSEGDTAKRLAIFCFNGACEWNVSHSNRTPLPFVLTDDAIYQRAPSVVLGTVDKMAMLGQNTETISQLLGMFGLARWIGPSGHLWSPRNEKVLKDGPEASGYRPLFPAYKEGERIFLDPFPSLIIQDEAHLLEESLGTFSGLFETLLDLVFSKIANLNGSELGVARGWVGGAWGSPRTPKIVAATATVADPERQLEVLYQRRPLRFPYPGPDIYQSFFSIPAPIPAGNESRQALARSIAEPLAPEATAPWMRLYVSLMTNGATHTVTSVLVLSAFHLIVTELWRDLRTPERTQVAIDRLLGAITTDRSGVWRKRALESSVADGRQATILALVDLHRIALTYVTNKKGGDQIMDALDLQVKRDHRASGQQLSSFDCRLISGGIDMRTIQKVMGDAETEFPPDTEYPDIEGQIRSVVATSAISHGVDVDRFNSMFFAGLPSDIAEYIQASSRVGRTHVGFVMLIPTPQSRRDRYVVETHDIFHRFLERMIAPPAVQRWAGNAIRRVTASIIQAWAMLKEAQHFKEARDDVKSKAQQFDIMRQLNALAVADSLAMRDELAVFMLQAIGFAGRGAGSIGRPVYDEVYRDLVDRIMREFVSNVATFSSQIKIADFWLQNSGVQPPMTSLRDVDEAGLIVPCIFDPRGEGGSRRVSQEAFVAVMKAIRRQKGSTAEMDREGEEPTKEIAA